MAQLDRATVCGTVGRRFESSWARSFFVPNLKKIMQTYLANLLENIVFNLKVKK